MQVDSSPFFDDALTCLEIHPFCIIASTMATFECEHFSLLHYVQAIGLPSSTWIRQKFHTRILWLLTK